MSRSSTSRLAFVVLAALAFTACSSSEADDDRLDPFSQSLLTVSGTPGVAGLALDGEAVTVYTLGERPEVVAPVRAALGSAAELSIVTRPLTAGGSELMKNQVANALTGSRSVDYDETTGYVRVGVLDASGLRLAQEELAVSSLDLAAILLVIETPPFSFDTL